ncbi:MAG: hypothetical protein ACP5IX_00715 [Patescibacteria group bacterium]
MTIPLQIFLYLYFVLAGLVVLFFLANFYHLVRFGVLNFKTVFVSFLFLAGLVILGYFTYQYLIQVNWQEPITIFGGFHLEKPKIELPF